VLIVTYSPHPGSPSGHLRLQRAGHSAPPYVTLAFRTEEWEPKLHAHICSLRKQFAPKPVIWAGDLNVSLDSELDHGYNCEATDQHVLKQQVSLHVHIYIEWNQRSTVSTSTFFVV
jgi:hypothetical protein